MNEKPQINFYIPAAILIGALFITGAILYGKNLSGGNSASQGDSLKGNEEIRMDMEITSQDHSKGNPNAKITLVEFSDLQCPFCQRFHPTAQQALQEYGDKIRWVYKHFPLDNIHAQARPAAEAAECVWEQKGDEGFWRFVDSVFENQASIGSAFFQELASDIGVDRTQFDTCVSQRKYKDKVESNYQEGVQAGVSGTPGSFVNGVPVRGAVPYEVLKSVIEEELKK